MYGAAAFVCMLLLFMWVPAHGFGLSLDEMYRMSLRDENGGILPGYIINRGLTPWPEPKPQPQRSARLIQERGYSTPPHTSLAMAGGC